MKLIRTSLATAAGLLAGAQVCAQQWFMVTTPAAEQPGTVVEVDLETVRLRDAGGEAVVRISYDLLRPHPGGFGYRSLVGTVVFDCQRRSMSYASAAYYAQAAGQGVRLGAESAGRDSGMPAWLADSLPALARQALLKAVCSG